MNKQTLIQFIGNHLPASKETAAEIAAHFEEIEIAKHGFFLKENTISNNYLFLQDGFMRAFTFDIEGNEVTTNFYTANNIVFEVASFFNHTRSKENIQALTDCKGYSINFEQLNMLFHSIPEFREFGRTMLVKGFVALKQRTLSLINESAEERYDNLINTTPEIFQYAQLKHIASYLGVTDTSLSRIRREYLKK
ncbi:MAG: Crp/Fnr family transcriptional regulator [Ferruginibacter sp.]